MTALLASFLFSPPSRESAKEGKTNDEIKGHFLLGMFLIGSKGGGGGRIAVSVIVNCGYSLRPFTIRRPKFSLGRPRADGNFVDHMLVRVRGGMGGDGVPAFARSARNPKGRPCGGDGGQGGSVFLMVDASLDSLNHLPSQVQAERGHPGGRNMRHGANGADLILHLPAGCEVTEVNVEGEGEEWEEDPSEEQSIVTLDNTKETGEDQSDSLDFVLLSDIGGETETETEGPPPLLSQTDKHQIEARPQEELPQLILERITSPPVLVAQGGRGGRGNYTYGQNNHECERGQPGEERLLEINLKTLADVGLVGLPNAGKSSLLAAITRAHPRIASYPFTTLNPYVGIIDYGDGLRRLTVADIPGLVDGAHANRGLGHQFLKHIEKARLLALVIDYAQTAPWEDIKVLLRELDLYRQGLSARVKLIIANKADLLEPHELTERIRDTQDDHLVSRDIVILPVSAKYGLAVTKVTERLWDLMEELKRGGSDRTGQESKRMDRGGRDPTGNT